MFTDDLRELIKRNPRSLAVVVGIGVTIGSLSAVVGAGVTIGSLAARELTAMATWPASTLISRTPSRRSTPGSINSEGSTAPSIRNFSNRSLVRATELPILSTLP